MFQYMFIQFSKLIKVTRQSSVSMGETINNTGISLYILNVCLFLFKLTDAKYPPKETHL